MRVMEAWQAAALVVAHGVGLLLLTRAFRARWQDTKPRFLVAGRQVGLWPAALSIASAWVWAPSLFVAAEKAYTEGIAGVFWFTVPNVACLVIFAGFAVRIRRIAPDGYTLTDLVRERYGRGPHNAFLLESIGLQTCSFAVQLLAGAGVLAELSGASFGAMTVLLAAVALAYSWRAGMQATVVADVAQMLLIAGGCFLFAPWVVAGAGGVETVLAGLAGRSGEYGSLFSGAGARVFWTFGIPVTIGLISGPFGDQCFWQRAFSTREGDVRRAFVLGAAIFALVPLSFSLLGFVAAGAGIPVADTQRTNIAAILHTLPAWTLAPFVLVLLSGLCSTLDGNLAAVSAIAGQDLRARAHAGATDRGTLRWGRVSMLALAIAAIGIANLPGLRIVHLFLFYGTLRASTLLPTVLVLTRERLSARGMTWGIGVSLAVGLPLFAAGQLGKDPGLTIAGSLTSVLASGLITLAATWGEARGGAGMH